MRRSYFAGLATGLGVMLVVLLVVLLFRWLDDADPLALPGGNSSHRGDGGPRYSSPYAAPAPTIEPSPIKEGCTWVIPDVDLAIELLDTLPTINPDLPAWKQVHEALQRDALRAPVAMRPDVRL